MTAFSGVFLFGFSPTHGGMAVAVNDCKEHRFPDSKLLEGLNFQSPHWLIMSKRKSQFATSKEVTHLQLHLNPYKS